MSPNSYLALRRHLQALERFRRGGVVLEISDSRKVLPLGRRLRPRLPVVHRFFERAIPQYYAVSYAIERNTAGQAQVVYICLGRK